MKKMKTVKKEQGSAASQAANYPILFKKGLPGLGKSRQFMLQPIDGNPFFYYLRSAEEEEVGLILVDPFPCFPSYNLELPKSEQEELELEQKEDVLIFTTVTVLGEDEMTTNLAAPIVINAARRIAKQIIIPDKIEQMRTPLPLS